MDEYCNITHDHPESYHFFMWKHLFGKVNIKPKNVNILDGNASDLQKECLEYAVERKERFGIWGGKSERERRAIRRERRNNEKKAK